MKRWLPLLLALLLCAPAAVRAADAPREFDFGFIASRYTDVNGDTHFRMLGPFYERAVSPTGMQLRAVRPIYGSATDSNTERHVKDIVWPVMSMKRFRKESGWRFLLTYYNDFDRTNPKSRYRFWSLPIYFQGRDVHTNWYAAVFPIGGQIHEVLGRDTVSFVLFPLYASSAVDDVRTVDWVWPIYSRTQGDGIYRFRVFPFYGRNHHKSKYEKRFILWPFWTWAHYHYPRQSGTAWILFPVWGHAKLEDQNTVWVIPPLFRFTHGQRLNVVNCPWPVIQWRSGEERRLYLWPLWGYNNRASVRKAFFLWPIFHTEQIDRGDTYSERFLAIPFIQSEVRKQRPGGPGQKPTVVARYHKLWPLLSYQTDGDARRFRTLELWPLRNTGPIERCYAPFWTLYCHTARGDSFDDELLWGLYRHQRRGHDHRFVSVFPVVDWTIDHRGEGAFSWNLLKGLVGYERRGTQRTVRVLYWLRFGPKEKTP